MNENVPQKDGVILRSFDIGLSLTNVCELTPGQTPNVDKVMPNIDWQTEDQFGLRDQFITHALANINVPTDGTYEFRLSADDYGKLYLNDTLVASVVKWDTPATGSIALTKGRHALRAEMFEDIYAQNLRVEWKKPGDTGFSVIPPGVLTYNDETMAHVTAPGTKSCLGSTLPGDARPLTAVNPAYDLVNLRTPDWEPRVSALSFYDEDTLIVTTWGGTNTAGPEAGRGEVFLVDGATGDDVKPENVKRTLIASNLNEPMGVINVDGKIYVSEKHQLTELTRTPSGPWSERAVATWPYSGNYHEFAFGLLYKDGYFYLNLSVPIVNIGGTPKPQPAAERGQTAKISLATGAVEYIAGGLRTPNGIAWGPDGSILTTDNQGDWEPVSKLVTIKQGGFYNHYNVPSGRFDSAEVQRPIAWFPQNEIGNSPSTPVYLEKGAFAGQVLVGDVTYGGLQRVFIDEVEGQQQGAVFRHTQGLEAGVNRTIVGPDGDIYIGGIGGGGNWAHPGKLHFGLQKLSANGTNTFDMKEVRATETGFDIQYTKPVSAETAKDLASKYQVTQWRYVAKDFYGGPKVNEEKLTPSAASLSQDGTTVSLTVPGLKENRVVHIRSPRPFEAADGESLWSTEAWYTANELPGYTSQKVGAGPIELEDGLVSGAEIATNHGGFTGAGFLGEFFTGGSSRVSVNATTAGEYDLALRYAAGPHPNNGPRTVSLFVNGESIGQQNLPNTGQWATWNDKVTRVSLKQGENVIEYRALPTDTGWVNLDHLDVTAADVAPEPEAQVFHQAETGRLGGGATIATSEREYSGQGYVTGLSSGRSVTFDVPSDEAGTFDLALRYANGASRSAADATGQVIVNGTAIGKVSFPSTASWSEWGTERISVPLKAGANTIEYRVQSDDRGQIALDLVTVRPHGERVMVFDGTDLEGWQHTDGRAPQWAVSNGTMAVNGGDIRTLEGFRDFRLNLDFKLPVLPPNVTGQDRGNSGIYLQDRYEIQVLDSFGVSPLKLDDAGAIYQQKAADVNAAESPSEWQNYVIEFTAARWENGVKVANPRVTAWWNGQKIHDNVAITNPTLLGRAETNAAAGFRLQDHGNRVEYRNVSIENIAPAVAPVQQPSLEYEAERAVRSGKAGVATNHAGFTGTGFVDELTEEGSAVTFDVVVDKAGTYKADLRYAAGPYWVNPTTRTVTFSVNGATGRQIGLPSTANWSTWAQHAEEVTLKKGLNRIQYRVAAGDIGFVNADNLKLQLVAEEQPPGPQMKATASTRCVAGRVVVATSVTNNATTPISVSMKSAYGTRTFASVAPGRTVSATSTTRETSIAAGTVAVSGSADGVTGSHDAAYSARSCS